MVFSAKENTGSTLVYNGSSNQFTYTRGDGTVYLIGPTGTNVYSSAINRRTSPNGLVTTYNYRSETGCSYPEAPEEGLDLPENGWTPQCVPWTANRLQSYQTNTGYMVHYDYVSNQNAEDSGWLQVAKVTALNQQLAENMHINAELRSQVAMLSDEIHRSSAERGAQMQQQVCRGFPCHPSHGI